MPEIFLNLRVVRELRNIFRARRLHRRMNPVTRSKTDPDMLGQFQLVVAPAFYPCPRRRPDSDQINRTVAGVVVGITQEVFRCELPVRREDPFVYANDLRSTRPPVTAIKRLIQMDARVPQIGFEIWRVFVPGSPDRTLVIDHARHFDQRPFFTVKHPGIKILILRNTAHLSIGCIGPGMIWTGKQ